MQARAFYERAGYHIHGEPWMEAGIPHITMQRAL
ncbi:MAG: GNAT family N-acetyltransferase [Giesbergeria sp.]